MLAIKFINDLKHFVFSYMTAVRMLALKIYTKASLTSLNPPLRVQRA